MYYYHDGTNEVGPFKIDRLKDLLARGLLAEGTLVRSDGSHSWMSLGEILLTPMAMSAVEDVVDRDITPRSSELSQINGLQTAPRNHIEVNIVPAGWLANPPTPWRRYGARLLDTTLNGFFGFFLFSMAFYAISPHTADRFFSIFESESAVLIDILLTMTMASLIGGAFIGVSGFTLGKLIFGVKVTRIDGSKLGLGAGLRRDFAVLIKGLGFGIPIIAIITMWHSFSFLGKNNTTAWDQGKYMVWHRPPGALQSILNVLGIISIVLALLISAVLQKL